MNLRFVCTLLLIAALVAATGCTGGTGTTAPPAGTATPSGSPAQSQQQTPAALATGPTQAIVPASNDVTVEVGEKEFDGSILVTFRGGAGLVHTRKIELRLTRYDGSQEIKNLGIKVGDEVTLQGTRGEPGMEGKPDRVEAFVTFDNGNTFKTVDVLRVYRSRM